MTDEQVLTDDQSHYEISLTAGQAFVAFVLLLLSLAASFAFGLMIGKNQTDERLVVRKEPAVITEASVAPKNAKESGRIVELGVPSPKEDFKSDEVSTESAAPVAVVEGVAPATKEPAPAGTATAEPEPSPAATQIAKPAASAPASHVAGAEGNAPKNTTTHADATKVAEPAKAPHTTEAHVGPVYAQLLSTGDQKTAEALAAKLIDRGFNTSYVERTASDKGPIFRVRVRFPSETEAHAAESKLREFSKDVWITAK